MNKWAFLALLLCSCQAFAVGEVFKLNTKGLDGCGNNDFHRFRPANDVDLFVRLDSDTQITLSITPDFSSVATFSLTGYGYESDRLGRVIQGAFFYSDPATPASVAMSTVARKNKFGIVVGFTGRFIQSNLLSQGCFSSGTFTSKRL